MTSKTKPNVPVLRAAAAARLKRCRVRSVLTLAVPLAIAPVAAVLTIGTANAAIVASQTVDETQPAIAYSPDDDEFLVVWQSADTFGGSNILGRRYDGAGVPTSSAFAIAAHLANNEHSPSVAFDPVTKGFLVAYVVEDGTDSDIEVTAVARTGTVVLQPLVVTIAAHAKRETNPQIAFNASVNDFVITYTFEYSSTDHDIYAARFDPTSGSTVGSALGIQTSSSDELDADVACAVAGSTCMVAYESGNAATSSTNVHARAFDASSWIVSGTGSPVTTSATKNNLAPTIAADDGGQYLVAWEHEYSSSDTDVLAHRVDASGNLVGQRIDLATTTRHEERPDIAFIDTFGEYYITWQNEGPNAANDVEIWARSFSVAHAQAWVARRIAYDSGLDNLAPAVALSGDYPDVGMIAWEHVYTPAGPFSPADTDIHMGPVRATDAP